MSLEQLRTLTNIDDIHNQLRLLEIEEAASNEKLLEILNRQEATHQRYALLEQVKYRLMIVSSSQL